VSNYVNGYGRIARLQRPSGRARRGGRTKGAGAHRALGTGVGFDLARAFYSAVKSPKQQLWLESEGQIDFYDNPGLITPAADAVAAFQAVSPSMVCAD
jgi:hypothetical protein